MFFSLGGRWGKLRICASELSSIVAKVLRESQGALKASLRGNGSLPTLEHGTLLRALK